MKANIPAKTKFIRLITTNPEALPTVSQVENAVNPDDASITKPIHVFFNARTVKLLVLLFGWVLLVFRPFELASGIGAFIAVGSFFLPNAKAQR